MNGAKGLQGPPGGTVYFWSGFSYTATLYYLLAFLGLLITPPTASDLTTEFTVVSARTLLNLRVHCDANTSKDVVFTLYKNGIATALTCTVTSGTASAADTTHTVTIAQGDTLALVVSHTAGSPTATYFNVTVETT